jgi:membrane protease subunit (stomatin/prohibitin family)
MNSDIDLEAQQVAQAAPRAGSFFPLSHPLKVVTARKEEVGGAETHEMDMLGPHTSIIVSSLRSVSGQDINKAQSVVSQAEGVTSIWPCCRIPRRLFCSGKGCGGDNNSYINIDQSRSCDDVSHTTSNRPTQAEAQTCACFLTILEISMT